MVALVAALALVASGCSSGGDDAVSEGSGDATATTQGGASGEVDRDGTLTVAYDLVGQAKGGFTWDPTEVTTQLTDSAMFYLVYGSLLRRTIDGDLVPDLAESTEVVDSATIEVTLRQGQTFSDGQAFDAPAVKASLDRMLEVPDRPGPASDFFDLEAVQVVDPQTLRLTVADGAAASWHDTFLASWESTVVPPGFDPGAPIGAGPMTVASFSPEQSMTLERRDDYWDSEAIQIKTIEVVNVGSDPLSPVTALAAGQVEFGNVGTVANIPAVGSGNDVQFQASADTLMNFQVCKKDGPLSEPEVRLAINKAIDRDAINDAVFEGSYTPAYGLWPDGHRFHDPSVNDAIAYDPEGAKALLEQAGYADGATLQLHVLQSGSMPEVSVIVQQQLADVGIELELVPAPNYVNDFLGSQKAGMGAIPTMSPNRLKLLQWVGDSIGNSCLYDDPALQALQTELDGVSDTSEEAVAVWNEIEQKVVADDALSIFLLFGGSIIGYDTATVGDPTAFPTTIILPDPRVTYVKAG